MCYFDDIFLSYVQHNNLPRLFQLIEQWWADLLKSRRFEKWGITDEGLEELDQWEQDQDQRRVEQWKLRQQLDADQRAEAVLVTQQVKHSQSIVK